MPIPLQPPFLYFPCDFFHFRCPSYSFISDLVLLRNSATSIVAFSFLRPPFYFPVPTSTLMHVPRSTSVLVLPLFCNLPIDLHVHSHVAQLSRHSLPVLPPALRSVGASASSSPSSANVDPMYVNVFTSFTVSPCKRISASWCSLHPKYSVFLIRIFNPRSSVALLHNIKLPFYVVTSSTLIGLLLDN